MDSTRWQQIQALFHHALELPESMRLSYLASASRGDADLAAEVIAMLREDGSRTSLLNRGLPELANQMLNFSSVAVAAQEFGPYRLKRLLGEGGMGVVWLAQRQDAGNEVAIKFLPHAALTPARRERFTHEIRTLAKLKHPFIASLYDAGALADGTPWFVMEYVEGLRLTEYCDKRQLSVDNRLKLFRSVCQAVQYAHGKEIIHRDLKPSNIFVDAAGAPRLLDFGIAKELQSLDDPTGQTGPGLRMMSYDYAAPEWKRDGSVGFYTDVYSLGVILYELLTGQLPIRHNSATALNPLLINDSPAIQAPSTIARKSRNTDTALSKSAWNDLDVLCLKALHPDPSHRYSSVEALIRDLDHYLRHEPLEAQRDSFRYRAHKFVTRNRRPVLAGSLLVVFVVVLVTFFTIRLAKARNTASSEAAISTAMNRFLTDDLLAQSNPYQSGKAQESFVAAVDRAASRIDPQFKNEPVIAGRLHQTIARAFDGRSNFTSASREFERAHSLFLQGEGPLSQDALLVSLQEADSEARSGDPASIARAESAIKNARSLIDHIPQPRPELAVFAFSASGVIAILENDAAAANRNFRAAIDQAQSIPTFDPTALRTLKGRLAFTYIRLGDGAKAEALFRELINNSAKDASGQDPAVLPFQVNLVQSLLIERKYAEAIQQADLIYPTLVAKLGEDHDVTTKVLGARAVAEGSLHLWDKAIADDLAVHSLMLQKQGVESINSLSSLSDAGLSQCRAGRYGEGAINTRRAFDSAMKAVGPRAGLTGGAAYALSLCLIGLDRLNEAALLLQNINVQAVSQLSGDSSVAASVALAQGQIAARRGDYNSANRYAQAAATVFDLPDADSIDHKTLLDLRQAIREHRPRQ